MPIDFHASRNAHTYTGREADSSWASAITALVGPHELEVVDVGCGGGTYSQEWVPLDPARVVALDWSETILQSAQDAVGGDLRIEFRIGSADSTGLPDASCDLIFARALVHHRDDLADFMREAGRILRPGGTLVEQDRTMEDVAEPGGQTNPRGYFFEVHPQLLDLERGRNRAAQEAAPRGFWGELLATQLIELLEQRRCRRGTS